MIFFPNFFVNYVLICSHRTMWYTCTNSKLLEDFWDFNLSLCGMYLCILYVIIGHWNCWSIFYQKKRNCKIQNSIFADVCCLCSYFECSSILKENFQWPVVQGKQFIKLENSCESDFIECFQGKMDKESP